MLVKTLQVVVHAEHQTLWNMLLDRLRHPERYLLGVSNAEITEEGQDLFISEMKLHGETVRERVIVKPYDGELRHELLEHPHRLHSEKDSAHRQAEPGSAAVP